MLVGPFGAFVVWTVACVCEGDEEEGGMVEVELVAGMKVEWRFGGYGCPWVFFSPDDEDGTPLDGGE